MTHPDPYSAIVEDDPYAAVLTRPDLTTARGRFRQEAIDNARLVAQLERSLAQPGISAERRAMLERMKATYSPPSFVAEDPKTAAKRFLGGVLSGFPTLALSANSLLLFLAEYIPGSVVPPIRELARKGRLKAQEAIAALQEISGAEGLEGLAGSFVGGLGPQALGVRALGAGSTGILTKGAVAPGAVFSLPGQKILQALPPGIREKALTGTPLQRVVGQTAVETPVNILQAVSIPDATREEKLRQFGINTVGSILGGLLPPGLLKTRQVPPEPQPAATTTPGEISAEAQRMVAQGEAIKAAAAEARKQEGIWRRHARVEWEQANPGKDWARDLSRSERAAIERSYIEIQKSLTEGRLPAQESPQLELFLSERRGADLEKFEDPVTKLSNAVALSAALKRFDSENQEIVYFKVRGLRALEKAEGQAGVASRLMEVSEAIQSAADALDVPARNLFRRPPDTFVAIVPKGFGGPIKSMVANIAGAPEVPGTKTTTGLRIGYGSTIHEAEQLAMARRPAEPLPPSPPGVQPPPPGAFLVTYKHDRPLEELSLHELDTIRTTLLQMQKAAPVQQDLDVIATFMNRIKAKMRLELTGDPSDPVQKIQIPNVRALTDERYKQLLQTPVSKIPPNELQPFLARLDEENLYRPPDHPLLAVAGDVRQRLISIDKPPRQTGTLHSRGEIGGFFAGFSAGLIAGDEEDPDRMYKAIGMGIVGAGIAHKVGKYRAERIRAPKSSSIPDELLTHVKTEVELKAAKETKTFMERMREVYIKRLGFGEGITGATRPLALPKELDPGFFAETFGNRSAAQAEQFLAGRPYLNDYNLGKIELRDVKNVREILEIARGDEVGLGKLMEARTVVEQFSLTGRVPGGGNLAESLEVIRIAEAEAPWLITAHNELRALQLALVSQLRLTGNISEEALAAMGNEKWYATRERVFADVGFRRDKEGRLIPVVKGVFGRKGGGETLIRSPYEAMIRSIPHMVRAAELNLVRNKLADLADAGLLPPQVIRRVGRNDVSTTNDARVNMLQESLGISKSAAQELTALFGTEPLNPKNPVMQVFRDGNTRFYRVHPQIELALRAMSPSEMVFLDDLGLLGKAAVGIANIARTGIVLNPAFVAYQTVIRDNFQMIANSAIGYTPKDWGIGFYHAWKRTPQYREWLRLGGARTTVLHQGVWSLERSLRTVRAPGATAVEAAVNRVKELRPIEAWRELVTPFFEAGRVGEYLRALGHGMAPLEAVYQSVYVGGNFMQHGAKMRAINAMTLFLNPALRGMDEAIFRLGLHPVRGAPEPTGHSPVRTLAQSVVGREQNRAAAFLTYSIKVGAAVTIPSVMLHIANDGDAEIEELRKTATGSRFWFFRGPDGEIYRLPKPHFEGQIFGTLVEAALDKFKNDDPEGYRRWATAMLFDMSVNLVPVIGAVPLSMWANKDLNFGIPIVPQQAEAVLPEYGTTPTTSLPARVVGRTLGPVSEFLQRHKDVVPAFEVLSRAMSPAGIDYLIRNLGGLNAQEAVWGLGKAVEYVAEDYLPPMDEWPFIRQLVVRYPTTNVESLRTFYRNAQQVDQVARTLDWLVQHNDVAELPGFIRRHQIEMSLIKLYRDTRRELNDLRSAYQTLLETPRGKFDPGLVRRIQDEMIKAMISKARATNQIHAAVETATKNR